MSAPLQRPQLVNAAFWCWVIASLMLIAGGLIVASVSLPAIFRGAGIITALAGAGMAFLARRTRAGDARFRRAAIALSLVVVVLVAVVAAFGVVHILVLLSVIPLLVGTGMITRPAAASFFAGRP